MLINEPETAAESTSSVPRKKAAGWKTSNRFRSSTIRVNFSFTLPRRVKNLTHKNFFLKNLIDTIRLCGYSLIP
jgi:hypothetical protein